MKNKLKIFIAVFIVIVLLTLYFIVDRSLINNQGNPIMKRNFLYSRYIVTLNSNISENIVINIPFVDNQSDIRLYQLDPIYNDIAIHKEGTKYGDALNISCNSSHGAIIWDFNRPIFDYNFSTQDNMSIYVKIHNNINHNNIMINVIKFDIWTSSSLHYNVVEYTGIMKCKFPNLLPLSREIYYILDNTAKLNEGWNKIEIVSGDYLLDSN